MQACGQIALLAIVAAVMSIVRWLKSSPWVLLTRKWKSRYTALQEERDQDVYNNAFACFADPPVTLSLLLSL